MIHKLLLTSLISFVGFCNPVFAGPSDDNHIHIEQVGGAGDDLMSFLDDTLADADTLIGGDGDDVLFGGKGIDNLTGGNGADTFEFCNQSGNDIIKDYNKADGDKLAFYTQMGDNQSVSFSGDKITWGSLQIQLEGLTLSSASDVLVVYNSVA